MEKKFSAKAILIKSGIYRPRRRRRTYVYLLLFIITLGGLVPGVYYSTKALINFLHNQQIQFNGDYLPSNLCKMAPFDKLSWCKIVENPILVDYSKVPLRDTTGESYQQHFYQGVDYANYGPNPTDPRNLGLIISPNLRYQYAYNTIVQQVATNAVKLNPSIANVHISTINIVTETYQGPLTYQYVDRNQLLGLVRVNFADNKSASTSIIVPLVIYNTQDFYNNYLNFMVSFHQINNLNTERDSIIMGASGRNVVIPQQVWTKQATDPYIANNWLYDYVHQMLNYFYFSNWQQFATSFSQLSVANNPLRNVILYSPSNVGIGQLPDEAMYYNDRASVLSGIGSILYNPAAPDNNLPYTPQLPLTQQFFLGKTAAGTVREPLNFYFLFLPPEKTLLFYYQQFGNNINTFYTTFNNLISQKLDQKALLALLAKYPFIKDLSFAPFQPTAYPQGYEHTLQSSLFYTGLSINNYFNAKSQLETKAILDLNNNNDRMAFFYRYWNAVAGYNLDPAALNEGKFKLEQNNPLPQNDFTTLTLNATTINNLAGKPTQITNYLRQQAIGKLFAFLQKFQQDYNAIPDKAIIKNFPPSELAFSNEFTAPLKQTNYTFFGRAHGFNSKLPANQKGDFKLAQLDANPQQYTNANTWKTLSIYFSLVTQAPPPTPWPLPGVRYTLDDFSYGFTINWKINWQ